MGGGGGGGFTDSFLYGKYLGNVTTRPPPAGMQFVLSPSQPPCVFHAPITSDWQKQQEALINRILDSRLRQMDSNDNDSRKSKRFHKFGSSHDRQSDDESDVQSVYAVMLKPVTTVMVCHGLSMVPSRVILFYCTCILLLI